MKTFTTAIIGITILLIGFYGGRYFERQPIVKNLKTIYDNTTDAEFIIPDDLPQGGKTTIGNCVFNTKESTKANIFLARYTYNW